MKLGKSQIKVLDLLSTKKFSGIKELADEANIQQNIVRNILMELRDASIVRIKVDGAIEMVDRIPTYEKHEGDRDKNYWRPVQEEYVPKLKLKNLSRIV